MRRLLRILGWLVAVVLAVVLAAGGGGYLWLRGSLAQTAGSVKVAGLGGPVEVLRDAAGVPHIRAASADDAMFGLGYVHAQDRLWQMEFQRRIGNARLSEVLGDATVETDTFLRTLGPHRAAARAWASATPDERRVIGAYVAGVNAFISAHHGRQLPVEFTILGFEPEPWRPEDVLVWIKMMAWNLGGTWSEELTRSALDQKLGAERTAELMPGFAAGDPLILPSGVSADRPDAPEQSAPAALDPRTVSGLLAADAAIQRGLGLGGRAIGSNNWVIGGARSATGKPLLANDPHLGAQAPSIWYLAHISGGDLDAVGATIPGLPGVVIGHNRRIAWGITNTGPDVQDLYIERISGGAAEYQGRQEPLTVVPETIKIKGKPDKTIQVRITRHGPLISDATGGDQPLAFRWTALDDRDGTMGAFMGINRAASWQEFTAALQNYHAPMQNFVYADVDGNIGYYAPGALPVRAKGDGTRPAPGWTGEHEWTGYVPFAELPHTYNPPEGYIASANNRVVAGSYPHFIGASAAAPYRALRIGALIQAKPRLSPDDIAAMQADVQSAQAQELLPLLLQSAPASERGRQALELLRGWDGAVRGDSAQAAIYEAWYEALPRQVFADELGEQLWEDYRGESDEQAIALPGLLKGESPWCDDVGTPARESCAQTIGAALDAGLAKMAGLQGGDSPAAWRWDRVHQTVFPHNPFHQVGQLRPIFSRTIPNGGDKFTVDVAPPRYSDGYNQYHVASYRQIVDLGNLDASRFMHTLGQSGSPLSPHYSDLLERWQRVEYLPMDFSPQAVDAAAREKLTLEP
jgi:penicillin amidase